jgi:hypothetical protein
MRRPVALALTLAACVGLGVPAALSRAKLDRTRLVVGQTSTSAMRSRLWACQTDFPTGVGASVKGPWFNADGTWNADAKISVRGSVRWSKAMTNSAATASKRTISGNGLPRTGTTGTFPVAASDPAYAIDRNPNTSIAHSISVALPTKPKRNSAAQCVGGDVGVSLDGPPIFSAIDAGGRDAEAYEVQDSCSGHPQRDGVYHYHSLSSCGSRTAQFGWALDGFPIMGPVDPTTGVELTNADLDECHGRTATITVGGAKITTYHYVANDEYPYTVGCFRGTPVQRQIVLGLGGEGGLGGPPPVGADGLPIPPPPKK